MAHGDMSFFSRPSSSAVKISAPPSDEPSSPKPSKKDNTQRQCRNILIYGHCKFQDKARRSFPRTTGFSHSRPRSTRASRERTCICSQDQPR
ncbi:hypothetical protein C8Q70DRAFT_348621 [Cubamyces menziesii]|nr:hypothetical protein C8Q70DRAFT_348621 [Cubamyces menziesii]